LGRTLELIVGEAKTSVADPLTEYPTFILQIRHGILPLPIHPTEKSMKRAGESACPTTTE